MRIMPKAQHGFLRAVREIIGGFVMSVALGAFASVGIIPYYYIVLYKLLNLILTISFILALPYWGTGYLLGWLVGLAIMAQVGLIEPWDFLVYFVFPLIILTLRFLKQAIS